MQLRRDGGGGGRAGATTNGTTLPSNGTIISKPVHSEKGLNGVAYSSTLPVEVSTVSKELLRNFPHTKRVGQYLLGRTLGEGSFAKVKEGLHILTGEKVRVN